MTTLLNIKIHEFYYHKHFGKVRVFKIEPNVTDINVCGAYIVHFRDQYDLEDTQCIKIFKMSIL